MKIAIFDFDKTLVSSPEKETGIVTYKEKTGNEFKHSGWWGRQESLDRSIFDIDYIPHVKELYDKYRSEGYMLILLTGRIPRLSHLVRAILDEHGLVFDDYRFSIKSNTLESKLFHLGEIITMFGDTNGTDIVMIDDRDEHLPFFAQFLDTYPWITYEIIDSKIVI